MASSISQGSIQANVNVSLIEVAGGSALSATLPISYAINQALANGTGAGQANEIFYDTRTLTGSASETLDLNAGSLKDVFGNGIALTKVLALILKVHGDASGSITIGGASATEWVAALGAVDLTGSTTDNIQGTLTIDVGGCVVLIAPSAAGYVVDSTHKSLKVLNNGSGSSTYDIIVIGK